MTLKVRCPACETVQPALSGSYCAACGTSLHGAALLVDDSAAAPTLPTIAPEPDKPTFWQWWFHPSASAIFRWPIIIIYPLLAIGTLVQFATALLSAFAQDPISIGIATLVFGAILLSPVYTYFAVLGYIHAVWTEPGPETEGSRIMKSIGFLILPHVVYVVVCFLATLGLMAILN